jgi:hypothetical protein
MKADELNAIDDHFNKQYFLLRHQTMKVLLGGLALFGFGTVGAAFVSARIAVATGTAAEASRQIDDLKTEAQTKLGLIRDALAALQSNRPFAIGDFVEYAGWSITTDDFSAAHKLGASNEKVEDPSVTIDIMYTDRPVVVSLISCDPGTKITKSSHRPHVGMDKKQEGSIGAVIAIFRDGKPVGESLFESTANIALSPSCLRIMDESPRVGKEIKYTLRVKKLPDYYAGNRTGEEKTAEFYIQNVRIAAWQL